VSVGKRRAIALSLVFVVILGICGACSSTNSKNTGAKQSQTAKQAKAAKAKAAKAKRVKAAARKRHAGAGPAAARRAAFAAAIRRRQARAVLTSANATPASDLVAVERTVLNMNNAFKHGGVAAGIRSSIAANYWVTTGVYSGRQCAQFERNRGSGVVSEAVFVGGRTFRPSPGWVDPVVGRAPNGRVYVFRISGIQTQVRSGERRRRTSVIHATVSAGRAHLFFRCK
jgi:hypothetical protein